MRKKLKLEIENKSKAGNGVINLSKLYGSPYDTLYLFQGYTDKNELKKFGFNYNKDFIPEGEILFLFSRGNKPIDYFEFSISYGKFEIDGFKKASNNNSCFVIFKSKKNSVYLQNINCP